MSPETHSFCRSYLKSVMRNVRDHVDLGVINHAWGYKYQEDKLVEFHINKCDKVPEGFYWQGRGCCVWHAKAEGWQAYLEMLIKDGK